MRHAVDLNRLHEGGNWFQKAAMNRQQSVTNGLACAGDMVVHGQPALVEDDFPGQRIAIRLQTA